MARASPQKPPQALSELRATFRRLPLRSDGALINGVTIDHHLGIACDRLTPLAAIGDVPTDTPFRSTANRKTTRAELDKLATLADALAEHVEKHMHAPAIAALLAAGVARGMVMQSAREVAEAARGADISHVPVVVERGTEQSRQRALMVARLLYDDFAALTGKKPTTRLLRDLVRDVFAILQINASPEAVARATVREKRGSEKRP